MGLPACKRGIERRVDLTFHLDQERLFAQVDPFVPDRRLYGQLDVPARYDGLESSRR